MTREISAAADAPSKRSPGKQNKQRTYSPIQNQRSINVAPEIWDVFKTMPRRRGQAVADVLGDLIVRHVKGEGPLPLPAKERLEATTRATQRELERRFEARVAAEVRSRVDTLKAHYTVKQAEYQRVIDARRGALSRDQMRLLERCLHPDNTASAETRAEAFRLLRDMRLVLVNSKEEQKS